MISEKPGEKPLETPGEPLALPPLEEMLAEARRADLPFQYFRAGVEVHWLRESQDDDGPSAAVLRYAPGASVPPHRHQGEENIYVISGAQQDDRGIYPAGTHVVNVPGSSHAVASPEGCVVLVVWARPNRWLD
jgi:anti-sigma factor ChrR (cupin superfamily)